MHNQHRIYIYAFLSRIFSDELDEKFLKELQENNEMLSMIGENSLQWFKHTPMSEIQDELNVDFSTVFLMNAKPIESSVMDAKDEILVGLQNPVMQFYFNHDYELNLSASHLQTPDHISIELAFMQNLISKDEKRVQKEFLAQHLLKWAVPYFIGIKSMCNTPLYKDLCDFVVEFLASDYDYLTQKI